MSADNEKYIYGYMAEFSSVDSLLTACRRIRDAGYTKTDAYTPFPVHGVDEALGIKPTALPWITLAGGLLGAITAMGMQVWMNGIDYQYIISGKPFISLPAFIPVTFELTILFASFGSFFGMLALNRLPRFSNPMFTNSRFDAATDDKFFLFIDADDPRYDGEGVQRLLADSGANSVDSVVDDDSSDRLPKIFMGMVGALALFSTVPALILAGMRVTTSGSPRFHVFMDMDFSPAKDAQETTTLFADGRAMRPDVPGTVAQHGPQYDVEFYTGIDQQALAQLDPARAERLVRSNNQPPADDAEPAADAQDADAQDAAAQDAGAQDAGAQDAGAAAQGPVVDNTPWLTKNPLELTRDTLELGQLRFNIYCAVCHGQDGRGDGLVAIRAREILASAWVPPSSLHQSQLYAAQYPDGKLFNTITHGIRKMPGYSSQISPHDRWAIVAYVRALQLSQNAPEAVVPDDAVADIAPTE